MIPYFPASEVFRLLSPGDAVTAVITAIAEGTLSPDRLVPMRDVILGRTPIPGDRPVLFTGSGMSWQDLVIAEALLARRSLPGP
ncbi:MULTISPECIES: hypothetical protein [Catenuloplanes]|uniref:Ornithine cyclodeaminase/alanine dehydrogenase-like protein (Mu-crystallin family) n=1 Tax=Catenuloplanes niger TaxID=587534 RepID=A0AAE3ZJF6_9ACTN|nr:hypothetical protein [Catenuloplanes niger]MDR7319806.1 ornithine cyclodeaminase/alanine dehydrogenase-like protein (mu-crystallin family) [Catenuloplanes niger]